jgi:ABC-2 type transport system ATP-binding protein
MLLGLVRPSSGTATVLGEGPGSPQGLRGVGALVESPAFYPYLSGRDNLRVMARYCEAPPSRVEEVLGQVELSGRARDKFKKYSLGMKQRLGVAAALLNDPELLLLDEPTNGLDPAGMAEMRELIRSLGRGDRTVILSSHLLHEVEQISDRVGVIRHGRMVAEGAIHELRGSAGLVLRAEPLERARAIAGRVYGLERVRVAGDALELAIEPRQAAELNRELVYAGIDVMELRPVQRSLEDVFMHLTEEDGR